MKIEPKLPIRLVILSGLLSSTVAAAPPLEESAALLYAVDQSANLRGAISVYDIAAAHRLIKTIHTVSNVADVRGVAASAVTGKLYVAYIDVAGTGMVYCLNIYNDVIVWNKPISPGVDRLAINPDGQLLYVPTGEGGSAEQGIGERGTDAGHRAQQAEALDEVGLGYNQFGQTLVEQNDIGLYPGEATLRNTLQQRVLEMAGLAFHRHMLVAELAAHRDGLGKAFDGRVPLNHSRRHDGDIVGDQARIDSVIFRQSAGRASKLPQFVRVDPPHREASCQQDPDDVTLVTAARFQADRGDRTSRQSSEQLSPAGCVVGDAKSSPTGRIAMSKRSIETSIPTL
jgi:hypothetical protein